MLRAANLALKFLLELAAVAALAIWGARAGSGAWSVLLAIALPMAAVALWGVLAAPKSPRRLPPRARIPFEMCFFGLAFAALLAAGLPVAATAFGVCAVVNAASLTAFGDWQR